MSCVSARKHWPVPTAVQNEEHEQIMEAIKAGNADLAEQLAHQHMINAYENMVKNGLNEAYAQQDKPQE